MSVTDPAKKLKLWTTLMGNHGSQIMVVLQEYGNAQMGLSHAMCWDVLPDTLPDAQVGEFTWITSDANPLPGTYWIQDQPLWSTQQRYWSPSEDLINLKRNVAFKPPPNDNKFVFEPGPVDLTVKIKHVHTGKYVQVAHQAELTNSPNATVFICHFPGNQG